MSIIGLLILIVIFVIYTLLDVQDYRNYHQSIDKLTFHYLNMRRFEQHFLLRYPEDPAFFTTGKNKYLKKHKNSSDRFSEILTDLNENIISKELHLNENLNSINIFHKHYVEIFRTLSEKTFQRGSKKRGIIGELEADAKLAYQKAIDTHVKDSVRNLIQTYENYLFNKDIKYYRKFLGQFKQLNNYINKNFFTKYVNTTDSIINNNPSATGDTILISNVLAIDKNFIKSINDFKYQFITLLKIDREIGMSYKEGLTGELRSEIHKVNTPLESIIENIKVQEEKEIKNTFRSIYIFMGFIIGMVIFILWVFLSSITKPLNILKEYIIPLSKGKLPKKPSEPEGNDEISEITKNINKLITGLKNTTDFAKLMGKGIFDVKYTPLGNEDELGNSLIEMRQNLNEANIKDEKRKKKDNMRKWANEGLTRLNDIMRKSTGNINLLSNMVIRELVYFLDANQGGLFIYNRNDANDIYLELMATYAFGHEKKKQKKIYPGEGLVGTAAIEKETIYMTDIPNSYITITSGLGGANPRSLLIVPMRVEDEVFGVIEIASFNEFLSYEIEFAEKVSDSIAASLSIIRTNIRTAELLEQSQIQRKQMAIQEKKKLQNFEQLQKAQEESAKREAEMSSILSAIDTSSLVFELDMRGHIISVNKALIDSIEIGEDEIIGRHHLYLIKPDNESSYNEFWRIMREGKHVQKTEYLLVDNKEFWFSIIYAPIKDENGNILKILCLSTNLTKHKKLEIELTEQTKAMTEQAKAMLSQEEEMRQNLEELHATQEEMANKQSLLAEANFKLKINEKELKKIIGKTRKQEKELQQKINQLNEIQTELQEQHDRIIIINRKIVKKEKEIRDRFNAVDKNNLVAEYDLSGMVISANNTFLKTFGYKIKDIIGRHHRMFVHDDDRKSRDYKNFWKSLRKGKTFDFECRRVNKKSELLFFRGIYVPILDNEEKPYKILEIFTDITKLKFTKAESSSRMENINATNALIEFDSFGNILQANKLFCKVVGYKEEELVGNNHKIFVDKIEVESIPYRHFWRDLRRGMHKTDRFSLLSKNKNKVFLQGTYSAIKDPQGTITKIMFLAYDLTEKVIEKC